MKNNASDELILVNEDDEMIGSMDKGTTHYQKLRHRAFSLFLYDPKSKKVMLHQRAFNKYHSGGLWTNSCCSHPRVNETLHEAVVRRCFQELGIKLQKEQIHDANKFTYFADYGALAEYEIDHVVYAYVDEDIELHVDESEIMAIKWVALDKIEPSLRQNPSLYSAWFPQAFQLFQQAIRK